MKLDIRPNYPYTYDVSDVIEYIHGKGSKPLLCIFEVSYIISMFNFIELNISNIQSIIAKMVNNISSYFEFSINDYLIEIILEYNIGIDSYNNLLDIYLAIKELINSYIDINRTISCAYGWNRSNELIILTEGRYENS